MVQSQSGGRVVARRRRLIFSAAALPLCAALADCAWAQTATPGREHPAEAAQEIDAVVVTARKRGAEDLQDVPQAISAVTAERLRTLNATDFEGYARAVPSLSFTEQGGGRRDISIRGVNAAYEGGIGESTVGVYLDEIPMTALGHQPDLKLFDVERVEILRGPQGTLYGEGSMGGTIRVLQRQPDLARWSGGFQSSASSTRHGDPNWSLHGVVNAPIIPERWAVRASVYGQERGGYIDSVSGKDNVNDERTRGAKLVSRLALAPRHTLTLQALAETTKTDGFPTYKARLDGLTTDSLDERSRNWLQLYTAKYEGEFDWGHWVTVVGRSIRRFDTVNDLSASGSVLSMPGARARADEETKALVSESRLSGTLVDGRLNWLVGGFYKATDLDAYTQVKGNVAAFEPPAGGGPPPPRLDVVQEAFDEAHNRQWAGFGELGYDLTDKLSVTAGLRYTEWRQRRGPGNTIVPPLGSPFQPGPQETRRSEASKFTKKLQATYQLNDDVLLYAQMAQGFRVGGRNENLFRLPGIPTSFGPDSTWNYEVGWKTSWLERRLTLNGAIFHIDWSDIQSRQLARDPNGTGLSAGYITNAGDADVSGFELEGTFNLATGLGLFGGLSYLKAELAEDQADLDGAPGRRGDRIPFVPEFTANASVSYVRPLAPGVNGVFVATYQYYGSVHTQFNAASPFYFRLKPQHIAGLQAGVDWGFWRGTLFVDNLLDHRAELNREAMLSPFGEVLPGEDRVTTNRPRTVGVKLERRF